MPSGCNIISQVMPCSSLTNDYELAEIIIKSLISTNNKLEIFHKIQESTLPPSVLGKLFNLDGNERLSMIFSILLASEWHYITS